MDRLPGFREHLAQLHGADVPHPIDRLVIDRRVEQHSSTVPECVRDKQQAGADDVALEDDHWVVTTDPNDFHDVRQKLEDQSVEIAEATLTMIPQSTVKLDGKKAETMVKLLDALDDDDDVQSVHANFEIDDAEMERLAG